MAKKPVKKTKKKDNKKGSIKKKKLTGAEKQENQLMWIVGFIVFVFLIMFVVYFQAQNAKKFDYVGLEWEKTDYGEFDLFHSRFMIDENFYNLYMRNDPRINSIKIENDTSFKFHDEIIISTTPEAVACSGSARANLDLGMFLGSGLKHDISGALGDEETAEELNLSFADCSYAVAAKSVILIQNSEEETKPRIYKDKDRKQCHIIEVGNCEYSKSVEKFILGVVSQLTGETLKA